MSIPFTSRAGGAGAAQSLIIKNRRGYRIRLRELSISLSAAPVAAISVTITEGSENTVRQDFDVFNAGVTSLPLSEGYLFEAEKDVTVNIAAPGGAVVAKINCGVRFEPLGVNDY